MVCGMYSRHPLTPCFVLPVSLSQVLVFRTDLRGGGGSSPILYMWTPGFPMFMLSHVSAAHSVAMSVQILYVNEKEVGEGIQEAFLGIVREEQRGPEGSGMDG